MTAIGETDDAPFSSCVDCDGSGVWGLTLTLSSSLTINLSSHHRHHQDHHQAAISASVCVSSHAWRMRDRDGKETQKVPFFFQRRGTRQQTVFDTTAEREGGERERERVKVCGCVLALASVGIQKGSSCACEEAPGTGDGIWNDTFTRLVHVRLTLTHLFIACLERLDGAHITCRWLERS